MKLLDKENPLFNDLVKQIRKITLEPVDEYEVAAVLESLGWNDLMVKEQFGAEDIFDLAKTVWDLGQGQHDVLPTHQTGKAVSYPRFMRILLSFILKNYLAKDATLVHQMYVSSYTKRFVVVAVISLIITTSLYFSLDSLSDANIIHLQVFENPTTLFTFGWAVIVSSVLVLGVMNSLILFSLGQPTMVFYSMLIVLTVDLFVGLLLSLWIDYSFAGVGLFLGSVMFTILTTKKVFDVLNNLDYYLYVSSVNNKVFFPSDLK